MRKAPLELVQFISSTLPAEKLTELLANDNFMDALKNSIDEYFDFSIKLHAPEEHCKVIASTGSEY